MIEEANAMVIAVPQHGLCFSTIEVFKAYCDVSAPEPFIYQALKSGWPVHNKFGIALTPKLVQWEGKTKDLRLIGV